MVDLRNADLSLMEFQVRYMVLFLLFSVIDCFKWFLVGSLPKNNQLMLEFLKIPFLVLHFSYYTLMTFLTMLSVISLLMVMILLSPLKCDQASGLWQKLDWLLDLNLSYEILWTGTQVAC